MTPQQVLHDKARKLATLLTFPEAIAVAGVGWCKMQTIMLTLNVNSCTQEQSDERLTVQVAEIEAKLKGVV